MMLAVPEKLTVDSEELCLYPSLSTGMEGEDSGKNTFGWSESIFIYFSVDEG